MKYYYLNKNKSFNEVSLEKETAHRRIIKILDGPKIGKIRHIHPEGIAWGNMYPRLFKSEQVPQKPFIFKGRAILQEQGQNNLVPEKFEGYRFQPFLSSIIDAINGSENILLTGGTGVGKTTHIQQLAARINKPVLRANFNGETRLSDFIGKINVIGGQTVWTDGILPLAMKKGYWLLLDELDFADPAILSLLHPVLEDDPCLVLKENGGEVIKPAAGFRIIATANSIGAMNERAGAYSGTNTMNEAFLDRWFVILVQNLPLKEEMLVVKSKIPGLRKRLIKRIVEFAHKVRNNEFADFDFGDNFSTRKVIAWARKTALLRCPIEGARISWMDKMNKSDHEVISRILETHFGKRTKKEKVKKNVEETASATTLTTETT